MFNHQYNSLEICDLVAPRRVHVAYAPRKTEAENLNPDLVNWQLQAICGLSVAIPIHFKLTGDFQDAEMQLSAPISGGT